MGGPGDELESAGSGLRLRLSASARRWSRPRDPRSSSAQMRRIKGQAEGNEKTKMKWNSDGERRDKRERRAREPDEQPQRDQIRLLVCIFDRRALVDDDGAAHPIVEQLAILAATRAWGQQQVTRRKSERMRLEQTGGRAAVWSSLFPFNLRPCRLTEHERHEIERRGNEKRGASGSALESSRSVHLKHTNKGRDQRAKSKREAR